MTRLKIVGVMGSGEFSHADKSIRLGQWLATQPVHLLTGGGAGVMAAVSEAFTSVDGRMGQSIGILPAGRDGYPNPFIEIPIQTHLQRVPGEPEPRNVINILSSDMVVILPGGDGTRNEVEMALQYEKPVIAWLDDTSQLANAPDGLSVTAEFEHIQAFILEHLHERI